MKNNQRNHWKSCLLGLLLLFTASGGMPLSKEDSSVWQNCKNTSQMIIQKLWEMGVKTFTVETRWPFPLPQPIECNDSCDPDSLNGNKMPCLQKIRQRLQQYHDLLSWLSEFKSESKPTITDLKCAVQDLLKGLGQMSVLPQNEGENPKHHENLTAWEFGLLQNETLSRLQSFSVLVARVFAHCADVNE